jgi:hypothetical protein
MVFYNYILCRAAQQQQPKDEFGIISHPRNGTGQVSWPKIAASQFAPELLKVQTCVKILKYTTCKEEAFLLRMHQNQNIVIYLFFQTLTASVQGQEMCIRELTGCST